MLNGQKSTNNNLEIIINFNVTVIINIKKFIILPLKEHTKNSSG